MAIFELTIFLKFVYLSKCHKDLLSTFQNSKKRFDLIWSTVHIEKSVELKRLPTIICGPPLLHKYETRKKRRRLRVGLNQVSKSSPHRIIGQVGSLHLPRLSSTDGDWDNLGGNMGCIYVHSHRHTDKRKNTQTSTETHRYRH